VSPEAFEQACLAFPGASKVVQWGGSSVYKLGPKVFAIDGLSRGAAPSFVFKASDMAFELLVEQGLAHPAPYLGRAKWVRLASQDALSDADLVAYLRQSYEMVAAKLTRALRRELGVLAG
jgi:predicted DNA-binding protein (MmcQ/YjbR family)